MDSRRPTLTPKDLGSVAKRFWPKVTRSDGCWEWTAARIPGGYGSIGFAGDQYGAHVMSWALANGHWPEKWVLHRCGNRICVRPDHLYEGDSRQNMQDALRHGTLPNASKTHCRWGHPFDEVNTYIIPSTGHRTCRACAAIRVEAKKSTRGTPNKDKTQCKYGHPFDEKNTGRTVRGRRCLECHRVRERDRHAMKQRQKMVA